MHGLTASDVLGNERYCVYSEALQHGGVLRVGMGCVVLFVESSFRWFAFWTVRLLLQHLSDSADLM